MNRHSSRLIPAGLLAAALLALAYYEFRLPPIRSFFKRDKTRPKYALLLGCALHDDGSMGREITSRCNLALKLYEEGRFDVLIASGGSVKNKWVEAEGMERYIHSKNPQLPILLETKASNTWENFQFTKEMIGDQPLLVITGGLHARRAGAIARSFFCAPQIASFPDFTLKKAARECVSRVVFLKIELHKDRKRLFAFLHQAH